MICGYPPFASEEAVETCLKIINCKEELAFPDDVEISFEAEDLIRKLVCPKEERLNDIEQIKQHPFFKGFDWDNVFEMKPPYVPELKSVFDTSNFEEFEMEYGDAGEPEAKDAKKDLAFVGYTYKGFMGVVNNPSKRKTTKGVTLSQIFSAHQN